MIRRPLVAITVGDPGGVGPEITAMALNLTRVYEFCRPLVIADAGLMRQAIRICGLDLEVRAVNTPEEGQYRPGTMDVLDLQNIDLKQLVYGQVTRVGGEASFQYVSKAIELALASRVDAITTGPLHKEAINLAGHHYAGHTEILATLTKTRNYCMMLVDQNVRISHVTTHLAFREVAERILKERILTVIELTHDAVKKMGLASPRIGVAGLNPHSGDGGLFGREEIDEIRPAVEEALNKGYMVEGPVSPDTVFVKLQGGKYDAVVAMYHDQGHIPMKQIGFHYDQTTDDWSAVAGVNVTLGLPIIRTSVDHGVAFDKAGLGTANPQSMEDALKLAADLAKNK